MKAKATGWTPGPWEVHSHGSNSEYIADITGRDSKRSRFIRAVAAVLRYAGQSEGEANARLMAAAPDMAELLTKVLKSLDDEGSVDVTEISAIRALLAKIKGARNA